MPIPKRQHKRAKLQYNLKKQPAGQSCMPNSTSQMRQKVERFFCRIKEFRRIATRYDKLAKTFMAFVHLVCAFVGFQPES